MQGDQPEHRPQLCTACTWAEHDLVDKEVGGLLPGCAGTPQAWETAVGPAPAAVCPRSIAALWPLVAGGTQLCCLSADGSCWSQMESGRTDLSSLCEPGPQRRRWPRQDSRTLRFRAHLLLRGARGVGMGCMLAWTWSPSPPHLGGGPRGLSQSAVLSQGDGP